MKKDYEDTLLKSQEITLDMIEQLPLWKKFVMAFFNLFSPRNILL